MTVEERTRRTVDELFWGIGVTPSKETVETYIAEALRDQIEDCAKLTDDESIRLDALGMGYKQRGDLITATRYSACIVTAAKLGREIRALVAPTEQTEGERETGENQPEPAKTTPKITPLPEPDPGPDLFYRCAERGHDPHPHIKLRLSGMSFRVLFCRRCAGAYFEG